MHPRTQATAYARCCCWRANPKRLLESRRFCCHPSNRSGLTCRTVGEHLYVREELPDGSIASTGAIKEETGIFVTHFSGNNQYLPSWP